MSINKTAEEILNLLKQDDDTKVSVALFGQPGSGKSTLINKIVGKKVADTGVQNDKTVSEAVYEASGLYFHDLPGYDTPGFPAETYTQKFNLEKFDVFLCVLSGKLHEGDVKLFKKLEQDSKICIYVVNKRDQMWDDDKDIETLEKEKAEDIYKILGRKVEVIFTSCKENYNIGYLIDRIYERLIPSKQKRWAKGAKAYSQEFLNKKREACKHKVTIAALAAAVNGVNPIPVVNTAVDVSIILRLFREIAETYGLTDDFLEQLSNDANSHISSAANSIIKTLTVNGINFLLSSMAGKVAVSSLARYIPFIGQAISASIGYALVSNAGKVYLDRCHNLAEEILKAKISYRR